MFKELFENKKWEIENIKDGLNKIKKSKHYNKNYHFDEYGNYIIFDFKSFDGARRLENKLSDLMLGYCEITQIKISRENIKNSNGTISIGFRGKIPNCFKKILNEIF